jgi:hypothetical protein
LAENYAKSLTEWMFRWWLGLGRGPATADPEYGYLRKRIKFSEWYKGMNFYYENGIEQFRASTDGYRTSHG